MGIQRESEETIKKDSNKSRSESTIRDPRKIPLSSPTINVVPEKKDRMAKIRESFSLTLGGKKEGKKTRAGTVLGTASVTKDQISRTPSPLVSPKSPKNAVEMEISEEDLLFSGALSNLQNMSKHIESFTDDVSEPMNYETFLKRKQFHLQTFDSLQKLNLANKVNVDKNEGYLYSDGLIFYSYLPTGKHLMKLQREEDKTTPIEVIIELFEIKSDDIFECTLIDKKITWSNDETSLDKIFKVIGNYQQQNEFLLKISINYIRSQEDLMFEDVLKQKDQKNEQKIIFTIDQQCEIVYNQEIILSKKNEEYKISMLLSDFETGFYQIKIYTTGKLDAKILFKENEIEYKNTFKFMLYSTDVLLDTKRDRIQLKMNSTEDIQYFKIFIFQILDSTTIKNKMVKDFKDYTNYTYEKMKKEGYDKNHIEIIEKQLKVHIDHVKDVRKVSNSIHRGANKFHEETKMMMKKLNRRMELEGNLKFYLEKRNRNLIKKFINLCDEYKDDLKELLKKAQETIDELDQEFKFKNNILVILENQVNDSKSLGYKQENITLLEGLQNQRINLVNEISRNYPNFKSIFLFILHFWIDLYSTKSGFKLVNLLIRFNDFKKHYDEENYEYDIYNIDLEIEDVSTFNDIIEYLSLELKRKCPNEQFKKYEELDQVEMNQELEIENVVAESPEEVEQINEDTIIKKEKLNTFGMNESEIIEKFEDIYDRLLDIFEEDALDTKLIQESFETHLLPLMEWIFYFELETDSFKPWEVVKFVLNETVNSDEEDVNYQTNEELMEIYNRVDIKVRLEHLQNSNYKTLCLVKLRIFLVTLFSRKLEFEFFEFVFKNIRFEKYYSNNSVINCKSKNKQAMKMKRKLNFILKNEKINFEDVKIDTELYVE
eukprot:gene4736-8319_t